METCLKCMGKGKLNNKDCSACNGTGEVEIDPDEARDNELDDFDTEIQPEELGMEDPRDILFPEDEEAF